MELDGAKLYACLNDHLNGGALVWVDTLLQGETLVWNDGNAKTPVTSVAIANGKVFIGQKNKFHSGNVVILDKNTYFMDTAVALQTPVNDVQYQNLSSCFVVATDTGMLRFWDNGSYQKGGNWTNGTVNTPVVHIE